MANKKHLHYVGRFGVSMYIHTTCYRQVKFWIYFGKPDNSLHPHLYPSVTVWKLYAVFVCKNDTLKVKAIQQLKNAMNTSTCKPGFNDNKAYRTSERSYEHVNRILSMYVKAMAENNLKKNLKSIID